MSYLRSWSTPKLIARREWLAQFIEANETHASIDCAESEHADIVEELQLRESMTHNFTYDAVASLEAELKPRRGKAVFPREEDNPPPRKTFLDPWC